MEDLTKTINFIKNLEQTSFDPIFVIVKLSSIVSLENRLVELGKECDNCEANLEKYGANLMSAKHYWGRHGASAELFASAISMGLSAQNIFDAVTIFGNNAFSTPQELIRDLEIYGDIKAAIFKRRRELNNLNSQTAQIK